jgi:hypothetical protein
VFSRFTGAKEPPAGAADDPKGEDLPLVLTNPRGSTAGWEKLATDKVLKFLQDLPSR